MNGKDEDFCVSGTDIDTVLHLPKEVLGSDFTSYGSGEEAHITLMESFNSLSKQMRKLNDLPLQISSIQGISPAFHFSEVNTSLVLLFVSVTSYHVFINSLVSLIHWSKGGLRKNLEGNKKSYF